MFDKLNDLIIDEIEEKTDCSGTMMSYLDDNNISYNLDGLDAYDVNMVLRRLVVDNIHKTAHNMLNQIIDQLL